jgi:hypothetical protein
MTNYWILVAPKNHTLKAVHGGYAEAAHGKSNPLRRMNPGDGVIYYSPKMDESGEVKCQSFTALGCVVGDVLYQVETPTGSIVNRRKVKYLHVRDAAITPLISRLSFIKNKEKWGNIFKFELIHISVEDFALLATAMSANVRDLSHA